MNETQAIAEAIVATLQEQRRFEEAAQPALRRYVTDKSFPLEDRFAMWSQYCVKEGASWIPSSGDFGLVGDIVRDDPESFSRYATYDWDDLLELYHGCELAEKYDVTEDEFTELLIETNFGSFKMDW